MSSIGLKKHCVKPLRTNPLTIPRFTSFKKRIKFVYIQLTIKDSSHLNQQTVQYKTVKRNFYFLQRYSKLDLQTH